MVDGSDDEAAIAMAKLLGAAQAIVKKSTSNDAENFDSATWLGQWLRHPHPVLGGRKPADLTDTPTRAELVSRLLGAIKSRAL